MDLSTRAILIEINFYNSNVNAFSIDHFVVEITPSGGVLTSTQHHSPLPLVVSRLTSLYICIGK